MWQLWIMNRKDKWVTYSKTIISHCSGTWLAIICMPYAEHWAHTLHTACCCGFLTDLFLLPIASKYLNPGNARNLARETLSWHCHHLIFRTVGWLFRAGELSKDCAVCPTSCCKTHYWALQGYHCICCFSQEQGRFTFIQTLTRNVMSLFLLSCPTCNRN